jgi:dUTP pyrophosphatase
MTECTKETTTPDMAESIYVQRLSEVATLPTRATPESAGLDLHSAIQISIEPGQMAKVPTDLAIKLPTGTYCQILSRSGMKTNYNIKVKAGTIDSDYTGNVTIILKNNSQQTFQINKGG